MFRIKLFLLLPFLLQGCQYDPHAGLLTLTEPSPKEVVGTYVVDHFYLPPELEGQTAEIVVELKADGTFVARNVPPWKLDTPAKDFFKTLISGTGRWDIASMGELDPGSHTLWGVYLRDGKDQMLPANFTGKTDPFGLLFGLGDPDSGYVILMKRKAD